MTTDQLSDQLLGAEECEHNPNIYTGQALETVMCVPAAVRISAEHAPPKGRIHHDVRPNGPALEHSGLDAHAFVLIVVCEDKNRPGRTGGDLATPAGTAPADTAGWPAPIIRAFSGRQAKMAFSEGTAECDAYSECSPPTNMPCGMGWPGL